MLEFSSVDTYIGSKTSLEAKIRAIDNVIDALLLTALRSAGTADRMEYNIDDGQSKLKLVYRSPKEVTEAINALETVKQVYVNRRTGRITRLVDSKNFRNGRRC